MTEPTDAIEETIRSSERLRSSLSKGKSRQVQSAEETAEVKATSLAWFNSARPAIASIADLSVLAEVDAQFAAALECSDRATTRVRYSELLKPIKPLLIKLRSSLVTAATHPGTHLSPPPDFAKLIPDPLMQQILARRWEETKACISCHASLAATIMMGGLLEGLLLAKVNGTADQAMVFRARAAPKDKKTSKALQLRDWTLKDFIGVAHELGWIGSAAKELSIVIRDYRNYVHPAKELAHGISIQPSDAEMFWSVFSTLAHQVVNSP